MVKEKDGGVEKLDHENALKPRMENQKHREAQKLTPILPECFADFGFRLVANMVLHI